MTGSDIVFGPHVLETLSIGMYSNPLTMFREYIQNSTDALDQALKTGIIKPENARIEITVDPKNKMISIRDNGMGVKVEEAYNILLDIANSQKDYQENRGFRGIGRLCALGCSEKLIFETSYKGEGKKTILTWDGQELLRLLSKTNAETITAVEVIERITSFLQVSEDNEFHYFEVRLEGVFERFTELLDINKVQEYISNVAPVPFDAQLFCFAPKIKAKFRELNRPIDEFMVFINASSKPLYKMYKTLVKTGHQEKTKKHDYVKDIAFFEGYNENGGLIYFGWYGITNFFGSISDPYMQGIRIRKGNILIGEKNTFSKFFPSEGDRANTWFLGEIYIYDSNIVPNSQRDDFERNEAYANLYSKLTAFAENLNKKHRRIMSEYNSAINSIDDAIQELTIIEKTISQQGVTSDTQRDHLLRQREDVEKTLGGKQKELNKIIQKKDLDESYKVQAKYKIQEAEQAQKKVVNIENDIVNADYATKNDLPSSYSRAERKLYQRIIEIIDHFFVNDKQTAEGLRQKIIDELSGNNSISGSRYKSK